MLESLAICGWVGVKNDCQMTCEVHGSGIATVEFGQRGDGLEMQFDSEALRRLVTLGTDALRDMDERFVRERSSGDAERVGQ